MLVFPWQLGKWAPLTRYFHVKCYWVTEFWPIPTGKMASVFFVRLKGFEPQDPFKLMNLLLEGRWMLFAQPQERIGQLVIDYCRSTENHWESTQWCTNAAYNIGRWLLLYHANNGKCITNNNVVVFSTALGACMQNREIQIQTRMKLT